MRNRVDTLGLPRCLAVIRGADILKLLYELEDSRSDVGTYVGEA